MMQSFILIYCLYVSTTTLKRNVDANHLLRTRPTFSRSLMVSVAVSKLGCTHGIVLRGTWGEGHRRILQECSVDGEDVASDLGDVKRLLHLPAGPRPTAHRVKDTIALLRRETPSFIGPELWPANSPELNPVDYRIWGLIQERVYQTAILNIDELKDRLIVVFAELKQSACH